MASPEGLGEAALRQTLVFPRTLGFLLVPISGAWADNRNLT